MRVAAGLTGRGLQGRACSGEDILTRGVRLCKGRGGRNGEELESQGVCTEGARVPGTRQQEPLILHGPRESSGHVRSDCKVAFDMLVGHQVELSCK